MVSDYWFGCDKVFVFIVIVFVCENIECVGNCFCGIGNDRVGNFFDFIFCFRNL